jgi:uncharacterized protein (TIGR02270 family)
LTEKTGPESTERGIVPSILAQHAEEAAFHWILRDLAVGAPHYSLRRLNLLDTRLDAHLDGLRIAGEAGWELCREQLAWKEAGEVFTGAVLALEAGDATRLAEVLAVASEDPELARGAISAFGWLEWARALPHVAALASSENALSRRIAVGAAAVHRVELPGGLRPFLEDADPIVRARADRAAGELGQRDHSSALRAALGDPDEGCRFWAAWSAALLGEPRGTAELRSFAESGPTFATRAARVAARAMPQQDALAWQHALAADGRRARVAVQVAGAIGDPVLLPWLLEQMVEPALARVAGEAFTTITGVDLAYHDLEGEWPAGFQAGPTEDPADHDVTLDEDEDLPFPDPSLVADWWRRNERAFRFGTRYLLGKPIHEVSLQEALREGRQRQRAAAALERVLQQPGTPLFEVRARADRQIARLGG